MPIIRKKKKEQMTVCRLCFLGGVQNLALRDFSTWFFFLLLVALLSSPFLFSFLIPALFAYRFIYCIRPAFFFYFELEVSRIPSALDSDKSFYSFHTRAPNKKKERPARKRTREFCCLASYTVSSHENNI